MCEQENSDKSCSVHLRVVFITIIVTCIVTTLKGGYYLKCGV